MTNSQKRGYIVLTTLLVLSVVILSIIQWRRESTANGKDNPSDLDSEERLALVGDTLIFQSYKEDSVRRASSHRHQYHHSWRRTYPYDSNSSHSNPYQRDSITRHSYQQKKADRLVFDLNEADTLDLQQLKGIGPVFSKRIVKYRNLLGGFVRKEQLMEVYGITPELYAQVESQLKINEPHPKQFDLNSATLNELKSHPYLDYYQAKAIVSFRQKSPFNKIEDLMKVTLIDKTTFEKVRPYIIIK